MAKSALDEAAGQASKALSYLLRWGNDEPVADLLSGQPAPADPPPRRASAPPPAPEEDPLPSIACRTCGVAHFDACNARDVARHVRAQGVPARVRTITVHAEPTEPEPVAAAPSAAPGACTFCGGGGTVPLQGADHRWHLVACPECKKDRP